MRWLALALVLLVACSDRSREPARTRGSAAERAVSPVRVDAAVAADPDVAPSPPLALPDRTITLRGGRQDCAAVVLRDRRSVLVVGGYEHIKDGPGDGLASVERLDLATGEVHAAAPMGRWRYRHTATVLRDGRVLVVGGVTGADGEIELYDPATDRWRTLDAPPSWRRDRWGHTATLLADGRVLVVGGILTAENRVAADADIFDPKTERWTSAAPLVRARDEHTATLLRDGRVLVTGGRAFEPPIGSGITYLDHAELYDPARDRWEAVAAMTSARSDHAAALLPDGRVLVAGGYHPQVALADAEIFDPSTQAWSATAPLAQGRFNHTANALEVGVVVAGGWQDRTNLATTEVFDITTSRWRPGPKLRVARDFHCAAALPTGLLLFGGQNPRHFSVRDVEVLPLRAFAP